MWLSVWISRNRAIGNPVVRRLVPVQRPLPVGPPQRGDVLVLGDGRRPSRDVLLPQLQEDALASLLDGWHPLRRAARERDPADRPQLVAFRRGQPGEPEQGADLAQPRHQDHLVDETVITAR